MSAKRQKISIDDIAEETAEATIEQAIKEIVEEVSKNKNLHNEKDDLFVIGRRCVEKMEKMLKVEFDDESTSWLESVVCRELDDADRYTSKKARKRFRKEYHEAMRTILDSKRWKEIADLLWEYGYFSNVGVNEILFMRKWESESGRIKSHGLTVAWQANPDKDWARIGIDSNWDKMWNATVLLCWPGVDKMGKRRYSKMIGLLDKILDPKSKDHRHLVKKWDKYHQELAFDMSPTYGKDA